MLGSKLNSTKGQERPDMLPMWGSGTQLNPGAAVVGQFVGDGSFEATDKDEAGNVTGKRPVRYVKLAGALTFNPHAPHSEHGDQAQHLALGVTISTDTRNKLDPHTLPAGCYLLIQFTGTDPQFNNMRRYRVEIITRAAYMELLAASAEPAQ